MGNSASTSDDNNKHTFSFPTESINVPNEDLEKTIVQMKKRGCGNSKNDEIGSNFQNENNISDNMDMNKQKRESDVLGRSTPKDQKTITDDCESLVSDITNLSYDERYQNSKKYEDDENQNSLNLEYEGIVPSSSKSLKRINKVSSSRAKAKYKIRNNALRNKLLQKKSQLQSIKNTINCLQFEPIHPLLNDKPFSLKKKLTYFVKYRQDSIKKEEENGANNNIRYMLENNSFDYSLHDKHLTKNEPQKVSTTVMPIYKLSHKSSCKSPQDESNIKKKSGLLEVATKEKCRNHYSERVDSEKEDRTILPGMNQHIKDFNKYFNNEDSDISRKKLISNCNDKWIIPCKHNIAISNNSVKMNNKLTAVPFTNAAIANATFLFSDSVIDKENRQSQATKSYEIYNQRNMLKSSTTNFSPTKIDKSTFIKTIQDRNTPTTILSRSVKQAERIQLNKKNDEEKDKNRSIELFDNRSLKLEEGLTNIVKTTREIEMGNVLSSTLKKLNDATIRGKGSTATEINSKSKQSVISILSQIQSENDSTHVQVDEPRIEKKISKVEEDPNRNEKGDVDLLPTLQKLQDETIRLKNDITTEVNSKSKESVVSMLSQNETRQRADRENHLINIEVDEPIILNSSKLTVEDEIVELEKDSNNNTMGKSTEHIVCNEFDSKQIFSTNKSVREEIKRINQNISIQIDEPKSCDSLRTITGKVIDDNQNFLNRDDEDKLMEHCAPKTKYLDSPPCIKEVVEDTITKQNIGPRKQISDTTKYNEEEVLWQSQDICIDINTAKEAFSLSINNGKELDEILVLTPLGLSSPGGKTHLVTAKEGQKMSIDSLDDVLDTISPPTNSSLDSLDRTRSIESLTPYTRFKTALKQFNGHRSEKKTCPRKSIPKKNISCNKESFVLNRVTQLDERSHRKARRSLKCQRRLTSGNDVIAPQKAKLVNPLFRKSNEIDREVSIDPYNTELSVENQSVYHDEVEGGNSEESSLESYPEEKINHSAELDNSEENLSLDCSIESEEDAFAKLMSRASFPPPIGDSQPCCSDNISASTSTPNTIEQCVSDDDKMIENEPDNLTLPSEEYDSETENKENHNYNTPTFQGRVNKSCLSKQKSLFSTILKASPQARKWRELAAKAEAKKGYNNSIHSINMYR